MYKTYFCASLEQMPSWRQQPYFFFLSMFWMTTYLNQLKVYNFSNCTTEHCVGSISCRVSHGVESPISTPIGPSLFLNLFNQLGLVSFPVGQNGWEQKLALVYKISMCAVYRHAHVFWDQKNFTKGCFCHQDIKTQQDIPRWVPPKQ